MDNLHSLFMLKSWLSGHGLFAKRPADKVTSLAPVQQTVVCDRQPPSDKTDGGQIGSVDTGL